MQSQQSAKKPSNKTKTNAPGRRKTAAAKNLTSKPQALSYKVPECSLHYGAALANPFDAPAGVCIPAELLPLPSLKTKTFARGRMALGTTGIGFITVTPNLANDSVCGRFTTATSVGGTTTALGSFTNQGTVMGYQLPFGSSIITTGNIAGRVAAIGVRAFYAGQALQKGGCAIPYEEPDNNDMSLSNYDFISSNPYAGCIRMDKSTDVDWDVACCYSGPVSPSNLEFQNVVSPLKTNILGILFSGSPGDIYEYEIFQHSEFIGTAAAGKTSSHSDPLSCSKVLQAAKTITADGPLSPEKTSTLWTLFREGLIESLPRLVNAGVGVGKLMMGDSSGAPQILGSFTQMLPTPKVVPRAPQIGWH